MTGTNFLAASMLGVLGLLPSQMRADAISLRAPIAGASVHAGGVDMTVYYIDREDHFEVIATYAAEEGPFKPARLRMALADGDHLRFGLLGMANATLYSFRRSGGTVSIETTIVGEDIARLLQ